MSKVGLLCICTNKYIRFVEPLWESAKKHFMAGTPHEISMFCFTNMLNVPIGVTRIEQEHKNWPFSTLMRYHIFLKHEELLSKQDYLFYSDADMLLVDTVGEEILGDLVATLHPGFFNKPRHLFTYETRPQSACYMAPHEGRHYFAGGFNGGHAASFLKMARTCRDMIDADATKGVVPIHNDESCTNRYLWLNPPSIILNPSYCFQPNIGLPFQPRLVALDKNHAEMRS